MRLPPPIVNPDRRVLSAICGGLVRYAGSGAAGYAGYAAADWAGGSHKRHPYIADLGTSLVVGATFGAMAGLLFPGMGCKNETRLAAIGKGAATGAIGTQAVVGTTMLIGRTFLGGALPHDWENKVDTQQAARQRDEFRRERDALQAQLDRLGASNGTGEAARGGSR